MHCKRLTYRCFTLNRKSVYHNLICKNQIIIKPLQSQHAIQRDTWVFKPFFRNRRCPLWKRLTILSKLLYNISKTLFNYLQVTGYLLHFIPTIIDIIIFRRVDNKEFSFIIKYMIHDTKLFLFFNPNFQRIRFLCIGIVLSPQHLMVYLYRH